MIPDNFFLPNMCIYINYIIYQFSSVTQLCLTLCDPMDCSMTGFPVHHQLPELTQIHIHWYSNSLSWWYHPAISSSIIPFSLFNLSQHQGLFKWVSSLHQVAKYWSFSFNISPSNVYSELISFRTSWISLQSKGLSRVFSNTTVQKHQFFGAQLSLQSNSHIHTCLLEKP